MWHGPARPRRFSNANISGTKWARRLKFDGNIFHNKRLNVSTPGNALIHDLVRTIDWKKFLSVFWRSLTNTRKFDFCKECILCFVQIPMILYIHMVFIKLTERGENSIFRFLERISSIRLTKHENLRNHQFKIEKGSKKCTMKNKNEPFKYYIISYQEYKFRPRWFNYIYSAAIG